MANSLAFVLALQKLSFKHGVNYTTPTIMGESNRFTLDPDRYTTAMFWDELVKDLSESHRHFDPKKDILKHMRKEFLTLMSNLLKARDAEFSKMTREGVVNLTSPPTISTTQGDSNDLSTNKDTQPGAVVDLMSPNIPSLEKMMKDMSTPKDEGLSKYGYPPDEALEQSLDLLLDKRKRHSHKEKRDWCG